MKFQIERTAFVNAVKRASGVISPRNTLPVLACVHVSAADNTVSVQGSNMDEWITAKEEAAVSAPGSACINAAQLGAWLGAAPKGALVTCEIKRDRVVMTAGKATASFATLPSEDYPSVTTLKGGVELVGAIPAIVTAAPYASDELSRFYLCGVAINQGHAVATNGHILCAVDVSAPEGVAVIIPTQGVRQIATTSPAARLWVGDHAWSCEDAGVTMGGKLIDGTFPDWQRIVPRDLPNVAVIDADALSEAVKQVVMAAEDKARSVMLAGAGDQVAITCRGGAMDAAAVVEYEGKPFDIGMNSKYVQTAMATFDGRVINMATDRNMALLTCDAAPELRVVVVRMRL
jgi:DNA polymerase-3 subunit beta